MAGWISSKLKVAEDFLHQIDQQAADSLKKNEKQRSDDEFGLEASNQVSATKPLLKEQLKKKPVQDNDLIGKSKTDYSSSTVINKNSVLSNTSSRELQSVGSLGKSDIIKSTQRNLTDSDWTELLSVPSKSGDPVGSKGSNGVPGLRRDRRDGKKQGSLVTRQNVGALDAKRAQKGQARVLKSDRKSDVESGNKVNGGGVVDISGARGSDVGEESRISSSSGGSRNDEGSAQTGQFDRKDSNVNLSVERKDEDVNQQNDALVGVGNEVQLQSQDNMVTPGAKSDSEIRVRNDERPERTTRLVDGPTVSSKISSSMKRAPLTPSNEDSDSDTDSDSSSGSESEREREERRKRRQQILAEKAAAKASEAIKEREDHVAKLEGEKQSLEKILEERAKQQVLEASELQSTMMETMEAVEIEKKKHNNTRMEALASLAKLETKNADLARSLASVQKTLELETNRVAGLRHQIELKEADLEETRRKMSSAHESSNNLPAPKGVEFERDILEAEYSFITDKVRRMQEKAKTLEETIYSTRRELENPTEVELELKRRLGQLTDHLIQKQAQVEALSSEKALLLFKMEAVSRSLDENNGTLDPADSRGDLESGLWEIPSSSKFRPMLEERLRLGKQHFGSLILQLDSIFCAGAVFLKRNSTARIWSIVYIVCLHIWVIYILTSHSPVSDEASSGAVVSLQNINNTGGS
ncbi:OLC1v1014302C1 [Oldenlandia corymbosa var. corymbosa]|uniref:OLC1v1014302C1 n=1 Tax=Oldenlandia corymbosa var. corymbosa TaxID=529605 RepID=A0AAV1E167_OLDCO|nr:OLC1v1014302C1 [Oldenlandia corymbosa var. corymbosa]